MRCSSGLTYIGKYDPSIVYKTGDVVRDGDDIKVFNGQGFSIISGSYDENSIKKILPKHCTSCGAPIDSLKRKCEYCGCEY